MFKNWFNGGELRDMGWFSGTIEVTYGTSDIDVIREIRGKFNLPVANYDIRLESVVAISIPAKLIMEDTGGGVVRYELGSLNNSTKCVRSFSYTPKPI